MKTLNQLEIEQLTHEEYTEFLAHGDCIFYDNKVTKLMSRYEQDMNCINAYLCGSAVA